MAAKTEETFPGITHKDVAIAALERLHELKVAFNFTRIIMADDARKDAGDMVKDVERFIEAAREQLDATTG